MQIICTNIFAIFANLHLIFANLQAHYAKIWLVPSGLRGELGQVKLGEAKRSHKGEKKMGAPVRFIKCTLAEL